MPPAFPVDLHLSGCGSSCHPFFGPSPWWCMGQPASAKGFDRRKSNEMKKICAYCDKWVSRGIESFLEAMRSKLDPGNSGAQVNIVVSCIEKNIFKALLQQSALPFVKSPGIETRSFRIEKDSWGCSNKSSMMCLCALKTVSRRNLPWDEQIHSRPI